MGRREAPLFTPDGRYLVVRGRLWRAADPRLSEAAKAALVSELMDARRAVKRALGSGDAAALASARGRVQSAKERLGERGPPWWDDEAPDFGRKLARDTPYAQWFAAVGPRAEPRPARRGRRGSEPESGADPQQRRRA